jgi:predicted transcriptional regulator
MAKPARKSVTVTARIPPSLLKRLEAYAKVSGRSKSWIVEDILDRYVDQEKAFAETVLVGIRELDAGLGIPHEEAMQQIRAHIAMRKRERRKAA